MPTAPSDDTTAHRAATRPWQLPAFLRLWEARLATAAGSALARRDRMDEPVPEPALPRNAGPRG